MKIALIDPTYSIISLGLRVMSSFVRRSGHETLMLFLPIGKDHDKYPRHYSEQMIEQIIETIRGCDVVGIGVITNYFETAIQLTRRIKKHLGIPIIWGDIHATVRPDSCISHADILCLGEGEYPIVEFLEALQAGKDYSNIKNLWVRKDGLIIRNDVRPLNEDLDSLPFQDYSLENHFTLMNDELKKMDAEILAKCLPVSFGKGYSSAITYPTIATRGCPHSCAYCCNNALKRIYSKKGRFVRRRSIDNLIAELTEVKGRFPFIENVSFLDDDFLSLPEEQIEYFASEYKEKVGLSFHCNGSPSSVTRNKIRNLIKAGMINFHMGIQSGSERINKEIYKRNVPNSTVLNAATILNEFSKDLLPSGFDILFSTYFETDEDLFKTLQLLNSLPKPFRIRIYDLVYFPGTDLYDFMKLRKLITDEKKEVYRKHYGRTTAVNYIRFLIMLHRFFIYERIPSFLLDEHIVRALNRKPLNYIFLAIERIEWWLVGFVQSNRQLARFLLNFIRKKNGNVV